VAEEQRQKALEESDGYGSEEDQSGKSEGNTPVNIKETDGSEEYGKEESDDVQDNSGDQNEN